MSRYHQGIFKPLNPEKYKGNVNNIVYRSSWELRALAVLDKDPRVIEYSSEELVIPYRSPVDNRIHRYFVDLWCKIKYPDGTIKTFVIEIKPKSQRLPPKKPKKDTKRSKAVYLSEAKTFAVNQAKWSSAKDYCTKKGWTFMIWSEDELGIK